MEKAARIILHGFLQVLPQPKRQRLNGLLSSALQQQLAAVSPPAIFPGRSWRSPLQRLQSIHGSWLRPLFATFTADKRSLFAALLAPQQRQLLADWLPTDFSLLKAPADRFFAGELLREVEGDSAVLPMEALPAEPLRRYGGLEEQALLQTFDLLGLYDLVAESKQIIERAQQQRLTTALTAIQRAYLPTCLASRNPLHFAPLGLSRWDGDAAQLQQQLRLRGINRLAKALSNHSSSLRWHLLHHLDRRYAAIFTPLCVPLGQEALQQALIAQAQEVDAFRQRGHR